MPNSEYNTGSCIAARFSAAAGTYHRHANIQRHAAKKLMALLPSAKPWRQACPSPSRILEIGCGTGVLTKMLGDVFPAARIEAVDISRAMTLRARAHLAGNRAIKWIVADARRLPETTKYPLIISNCTLHWIAPIQLTIQKLAAMLEPEGTLAFAVMTRGTFTELNESRKRIAPHKPARIAMPPEGEMKKALSKANLHILTEKAETIRQEYSSAEKMLKQLHDQGLTGGNIPRASALLTRSEICRLIADYSDNYKNKDGVHASYRVFYCIAVKKAGTIKPIKSRGCHSRQSACGGLIGNPGIDRIITGFPLSRE